jgi:hypothetical protein
MRFGGEVVKKSKEGTPEKQIWIVANESMGDGAIPGFISGR